MKKTAGIWEWFRALFEQLPVQERHTHCYRSSFPVEQPNVRRQLKDLKKHGEQIVKHNPAIERGGLG